jgi:hypothetical protein
MISHLYRKGPSRNPKGGGPFAMQIISAIFLDQVITVLSGKILSNLISLHSLPQFEINPISLI